MSSSGAATIFPWSARGPVTVGYCCVDGCISTPAITRNSDSEKLAELFFLGALSPHSTTTLGDSIYWRGMDRPPPNQQPPYYVSPFSRPQHPQRPRGNPFPNNNSRPQASSYPVQSTSAWSSAHQPEDHLPNASSELSSSYAARPVVPPSIAVAADARHTYGSSGGSGSSTTMSRGMAGRIISNATGNMHTRAGSNGRGRGISGEERSRSTTAPSMDRRSSAPSRALSLTTDPRKIYIGMIRVGTPPGTIRNLFTKFGLYVSMFLSPAYTALALTRPLLFAQ